MALRIILFNLFFLFNNFASAVPLNEFNHNLLERLRQKKPLSAQEFKDLRIRLGTEIQSAEDASERGGELLKFLEYTSVFTYQFNDENQIQFVKTMWDKFFKLQNTSGRQFDVEALLNIDIEPAKRILNTLQKTDFIIEKFMGQNKFSFSLVKFKCDTLMYLKQTQQLKTCWEKFEKRFNFTDDEKRELRNQQISYYYARTLSSDLLALSQKIAKEPNLKQIENRMQWTQFEIKLASTAGKKFEKEYERLLALDKNDTTPVSLKILYCLRTSDIEKAFKLFQTVSNQEVSNDKKILNYKIFAELFYKRGEFLKADLYINKILVLETDPIGRLPFLLIKACLDILNEKNEPNSLTVSAAKESAKWIKDLEIDDRELVITNSLVQALIFDRKVSSSKLKEMAEDYKKFQYDYEFTVQLLEATQEKIMAQLDSKDKK
jgi:hypothetical protein